ncbi:WbqC family protein [Candidatus Endoriftia persephonae]|jgi:hypothetical protein|uniref:WbqC-like family protein n=2 Tax=Gammaproteobacteria TaxID=1236 RepID=G2FB53_9GAMM|nr:WbqC family protein [Candidatus Endoriftia persephone]EGW55991.1 hypothetical protein TevJSym_aa01350 [endosymbiont of Tevnia jerichonana (vent Tica)]USF88120.1 WbqC family protein [Candidatus Endoriftia persephone]
MILSINQPAYLPWLGYFQRIARSDLHVILDHVQFEKNSMVNRNRIRTHDGWCWLTVPVKTRHRFGDLVIHRLTLADDPRWRRKHWDSLRFNYAKAPYFAEHAGFFEASYQRDWQYLIDLNLHLTRYLLDAFAINTPLLRSSQLMVDGEKSQLLLNLCRSCGADRYLSGPFGRDYLDLDAFSDAGIQVEFDDYQHPRYTQIQSRFEPYMSAVDLLFNQGPASLKILLAQIHSEAP